MQPKKKSAIIADQVLALVQAAQGLAIAKVEKAVIVLTIKRYQFLLS